MRITCPNCGAQYEVPTEVIPPQGRDVQCSNCGDTWFQAHPDQAEAPDPQPAAEAAPEPQPVPEPAPATEPEPQPETWPETQPESQPETQPETQPAPTAQAAPQPESKPVDPAISSILREEAERESGLRAQEQESLETQTELGLDAQGGNEEARRREEAQSLMARMRGEEPVASQADAEIASRRGLLPDIEEINSTLRNDEPTAVAVATATPRRRGAPRRSGGFMRGFTLVIVLGLMLAILYLNAQPLARSLPQAEPMLNAYVALVDQARVWLDAKAGVVLPK